MAIHPLKQTILFGMYCMSIYIYIYIYIYLYIYISIYLYIVVDILNYKQLVIKVSLREMEKKS